MAVTRTANTENPGLVAVKISAGEYLRFTVDAGGPGPSFTMSGADGVIFAPKVDQPQASYEWFRFKNPADPAGFDVLVLTLIFLTNKKYNYKAELCNAAGLQSTIFDIAYEGAPTDHTAEDLRVVTQ